jgi:hypothetical protein
MDTPMGMANAVQAKRNAGTIFFISVSFLIIGC